MTRRHQPDQLAVELAADSALQNHDAWVDAYRDSLGNAVGNRAVFHQSTEDTIRQLELARAARAGRVTEMSRESDQRHQVARDILAGRGALSRRLGDHDTERRAAIIDALAVLGGALIMAGPVITLLVAVGLL